VAVSTDPNAARRLSDRAAGKPGPVAAPSPKSRRMTHVLSRPGSGLTLGILGTLNGSYLLYRHSSVYYTVSGAIWLALGFMQLLDFLRKSRR
jgi:hypothetical protein